MDDHHIVKVGIRGCHVAFVSGRIMGPFGFTSMGASCVGAWAFEDGGAVGVGLFVDLGIDLIAVVG